MLTCKPIEDYIAYAEKHPERINKLRWLLIDNIIKPTLRRPDVYWDEQMYEKCVKYCENNYYQLFLYQKMIYACVFLYKNNGTPVFTKFIILMGRGNGKDGFIVPLVNFFQTPIFGTKNYHIDIAANAEKQAKDTFNVAYDMLYKNPKFKNKFSVTKELIKNLATGSELKYNTSKADTKDGKKIGCLVLNEIHAYENYDQINVFESALGKIAQPREFILTTNGYTREGPLDDTLDLCKDILESGENPLDWFPFLCMMDDLTEVDKKEAWGKANPSLEYMPVLTERINKEYLEMQQLPSKRPEFLTKRMNMPARNEEQTVTSWENILRCCYIDVEKKIERADPSELGQLAVVGIDYADIRDFASAGVLTKVDEEYVWRQFTWICRQSPFFESIKFPMQNIGQEGYKDFKVVDEPVIPVQEIVEWCCQKTMEYSVQKIAMDTYRYTLFKQAFMDAGISIESRDNPEGTVRLIRRIASVTGIIAPTIEALFAEGKINYGNSSIMRWYTNNTCVVTDKFGNKTFGKIEAKLRKNDGFMAFTPAMYCKDLLEERIVYV
jgi:phage terminase large subunit-like protein